MDTLPAVEVAIIASIVLIVFIILAIYLVKSEDRIEKKAKRYFRRENKPLK